MKFLMRNQVMILLWISYMNWVAFSSCFQDSGFVFCPFSHSLSLYGSLWIYLTLNILTSWICMFKSLITFEIFFFAFFSSNNLSAPFSYSSHSPFLIMWYWLLHLMMFHRFLRFCSLIILFISVSYLRISIVLSSSSPILFSSCSNLLFFLKKSSLKDVYWF